MEKKKSSRLDLIAKMIKDSHVIISKDNSLVAEFEKYHKFALEEHIRFGVSSESELVLKQKEFEELLSQL